MEMKIIDLLNRIANGEEVPKKIKYRNVIYTYVEDLDYKSENDSFLMDAVIINKEDLNQKVKVIEEEIIEEDKKIRKIYTFPGLDDDDYAYEDGNKPNNVKINNKMEELLIDKINEIIDYLEEKEWS